MTHEEKLNELKEAIRKAIPRLMELSEGCIVKPHKQNQFILDATFEVRKLKTGFYIRSIIEPFEPYYEYEISIIGHEPKLNDVLEWLGYNYAIVAGGGFLMKNTGDMNFKCIEVPNVDEYRHLKWDLSKSYLKDQSPELIDFLHYLIPNK